MVRNAIYFEKTGKTNSKATLEAARDRAVELGIKSLLVASTHGYTAKKAAEIFKGTGIRIIAVGISNSYTDEGWNMTHEERKEMEKKGIEVLVTLHGLADGVNEAFLKDKSPGSIVADTFRCFSQGMKVAVEIAIMAVEAGVIPVDDEIASVAGTGEGADTAIILKPSYARKFKDLKICEIIAKPRIGE